VLAGTQVNGHGHPRPPVCPRAATLLGRLSVRGWSHDSGCVVGKQEV